MKIISPFNSTSVPSVSKVSWVIIYFTYYLGDDQLTLLVHHWPYAQIQTDNMYSIYLAMIPLKPNYFRYFSDTYWIKTIPYHFRNISNFFWKKYVFPKKITIGPNIYSRSQNVFFVPEMFYSFIEILKKKSNPYILSK